MILSGKEIEKRLGNDIDIDPFKPENLNPNSYNLTLHTDVLIYEEVVLDMKKSNRVKQMAVSYTHLTLPTIYSV